MQCESNLKRHTNDYLIMLYPTNRFDHILMSFYLFFDLVVGQFIDHDLSHVPIIRFPDMSGIQCCSSMQADVTHPACFPIDIPPNDFNNRGLPCMNFVRSMTAPRLDCSFGHADQVRICIFIVPSVLFNLNLRCAFSS